MKWLLVIALSFICLVKVDSLTQLKLDWNEELGCEVFSEWKNAHGERRYWILHCPNEALGLVKADGRWLP